jgi:hypothetical protein
LSRVSRRTLKPTEASAHATVSEFQADVGQINERAAKSVRFFER